MRFFTIQNLIKMLCNTIKIKRWRCSQGEDVKTIYRVEFSHLCNITVEDLLKELQRSYFSVHETADDVANAENLHINMLLFWGIIQIYRWIPYNFLLLIKTMNYLLVWDLRGIQKIYSYDSKFVVAVQMDWLQGKWEKWNVVHSLRVLIPNFFRHY